MSIPFHTHPEPLRDSSMLYYKYGYLKLYSRLMTLQLTEDGRASTMLMEMFALMCLEHPRSTHT